ncbi:MAG: TonB-dependent receptor, partial [Opitutae bacterium]|nr:TonB-dependent receptor [Opitutae bacterium]
MLSTDEKALSINLDESKYGTFAEIGAGQEVVRHFFQAGATAGTVAKSISAYDMKFSDEIYGQADRYVSRGRLIQMLEHEYALLEERLTDARGNHTTFFAFANTVAAQSFRGGRECHGWMGMRFQLHPGSPPCEIIIHVRMLDNYNLQQQEALGVFGVNLVYGSFHLRDDPRQFICSLADNLGKERIEVDMIQFLGSGFDSVDNRILSLMLVQEGMTNAVIFDCNGNVQQPAEVLYKKAVLMERGSFH